MAKPKPAFGSCLTSSGGGLKLCLYPRRVVQHGFVVNNVGRPEIEIVV